MTPLLRTRLCSPFASSQGRRLLLGTGILIVAVCTFVLIFSESTFQNLHLYVLLLGLGSMAAGGLELPPGIRLGAALLLAVAGYLLLLAALPFPPFPQVVPWRALGVDPSHVLGFVGLVPLAVAVVPGGAGERGWRGVLRRILALVSMGVIAAYLATPQTLSLSKFMPPDSAIVSVPVVRGSITSQVSWHQTAWPVRPSRALRLMALTEVDLSDLAWGLAEASQNAREVAGQAPDALQRGTRTVLWRVQRPLVQLLLAAMLLAPVLGTPWALLPPGRTRRALGAVVRAVLRGVFVGIPLANLCFLLACVAGGLPEGAGLRSAALLGALSGLGLYGWTEAAGRSLEDSP
jgi:hypothetical protein